MWWDDIAQLAEQVARNPQLVTGIDPSAQIARDAELDETHGPISIGAGTTICSGTVIRGPVIVGADCMIGNRAMIRGATVIGDRVRVGYCSEIKHSVIGEDTAIGPLCFVADSLVEHSVYLGALVRTSNERLDHTEIRVLHEGSTRATGLRKLGCYIGAGSALGIQVVVLPGRVIAPTTVYEPRITVARNLPTGRYRAVQTLEAVSQEHPS